MRLFYIRHHFQSLVRSNSFGGEVIAFFLILGMFASSGMVTYGALDSYAEKVANFFGSQDSGFQLIIICYLLLDLMAKLVFRRPFPKLKYYVFLGDQTKAISSQYLFTSLFGIIPFALFLSLLTMSVKADSWLGSSAAAVTMVWWLANHYLALSSQFGRRWVRQVLFAAILLMLLLLYWASGLALASLLLNPTAALVTLLFSVAFAYRAVRVTIEGREAYDEKPSVGFLENLPVFHFRNPIFQLEWALIARNKRTRSNILMGLISVLILPFLMLQEADLMVVAVIYFITTGFFIIQHGVYSLGWEGSYFDFLICNISPKTFIQTRYIFYMGTCLVGLLLASVSTIILGHDWLSLFAVFLYNVGVTIPIVLYRSTMNSTKIVLSENSFMNYNGMMTGPIFLTSFIVVFLPLLLFGFAQGVAGARALHVLGALGLLGLALFRPITKKIAGVYQRRKYALSQSFKA